MKALSEILNTQTQNLMSAPKFYRFQVFTENDNKKKIVGMAYLKEGQKIYTLRLWTFLENKFFILPSKDDPSKYLLMTRELNKSNSKNKYFWNIVGNGEVNSNKGSVEIRFDLFDKKIFMDIFPDESAAFKRDDTAFLEHQAA